MTEAGLTRRERQRQATMDEIVRTARGQLSEPGGLSLRAIAQEMGITAPALYRYVSSLEGLTLNVTTSIYDEIVEVLHEAADRHAESPEARIVAAATAYRQWSLRHRDEFVLCFVTQITDPSEPEQDACAIAGGRFRQFFADLFVEIWHRRPFAVPSEAEFAEIAALMDDPMNPFRDEHDEWVDSEVPASVQWIFLQVWTRLFGIVALEVFGHVSPPLVESAALFRAVSADCAGTIGIDAAALPGFESIVGDELSR
ncbi:TetR/AcrR family transcriptional regulator [Solicola gregarius]|uniref:TetR/AcrR family transcriptional regulator n=1 Tax=Solicola gregarius TaxID=2908642 RepID=A0AA46TFS9_9ACTN|nr:WHG domain-containing protein [Solicola gregarius]UYM04539.1 TetR/AcrR family transcriptional regulator [Solicola gregarius]